MAHFYREGNEGNSERPNAISETRQLVWGKLSRRGQTGSCCGIQVKVWWELRAGSRKLRRQAGLSRGRQVPAGRERGNQAASQGAGETGHRHLAVLLHPCRALSLTAAPGLLQRSPLLSHPEAGTVLELPESSCRAGQCCSPAPLSLHFALAWPPADCAPLRRSLYLSTPDCPEGVPITRMQPPGSRGL